MSDDSDVGTRQKRKRNPNRILDTSVSSASSGSPIIGSSSRRRRIEIRRSITDDSDSDDGNSIEFRRRKRVARVESDSDSESSGSEIVQNCRRRGRIMSDSENDSNESDHEFGGDSSSQWESDFSDNDVKESESANATAKVQDIGVDSDSSDGQSEKCPICLLSFKTQEIGSPESCDHIFCVECIQEWSKNMNTCPVDRQKYSLILVRKSINGKIIRQIPVQTPTPQNEIEIIEDPTFCEICGSSDREERMLLCDGCDLGYHLECLTPPLEDIPAGSWYCPDCGPNNSLDDQIQLYELQLFLDDSSPVTRRRGGRRRTSSPRLIPRTRRTERIRNRIISNRVNNVSQYDDNESVDQPSTSVQNEADQAVQHDESSTNRQRPKQKKRKKRRRKKRYRTVYEIDEATGETVVVKKRRLRRRRNRERPQVQPKSVKKRLALHLGICAPRTVPQSLPDVKIQISAGGINHQRYQAGIPTLNLFGNRETLDYFSPSDDEVEYSAGNSGYLVRRAPNRSDVSVLQRIARRKSAIISPPSVTSSSDVLGSIMDSQAKFHSKNTVFSLDPHGKFKMSTKDSFKKDTNKPDLKLQDCSKLVKQAPGYSHNEGNNRGPPPNVGPNMYQYNTGYSYSYLPPPSYQSQASMPSYSRMNDNYDVPQDYSQRTLSASYLYPPPEDNRRRDRNENASSDNTPRSNTPNTDPEIDIYSDIENETVSTSRLEDFYLKPPPTPPILRTPPSFAADEDDRDSEADMVIDTEKVDPEKYDPAACDYEDDLPEEGQVTSTVDTTEEAPIQFINSYPAESADTASEIQSQAIQSSDQVFDKRIDDDDGKEDRDQDDDDMDSEDGCPNFSIYSKESINLAKTTDLTMMQASSAPENNQVEEISSTPDLASKPIIMQNVWSDDDDDVAPEPEDRENSINTSSNQENATDNLKGGMSDDLEEVVSDKLREAVSGELKEIISDDTKEAASDELKEATSDELKEATSDELKEATSDELKEATSDELKEATSDGIKEAVTDDMKEAVTDEMKEAVTDDMKEAVSDELKETTATSADNVANDSWEDSEKNYADNAEKTVQSDWEDEENETVHKSREIITKASKKTSSKAGGLYSDSEDETVVKKDGSKFAISDIQNMTEDISEEERSYTPCLDEHRTRYKGGLEGLDTEMISDEDRNDFDESHELKTGSDGDALEINAKESELEFTRPEDYEEGEIIDKSKSRKENEVSEMEEKTNEDTAPQDNLEARIQEIIEKGTNKANEGRVKDASFKKLSKSNKERNYRGDKEKDKENRRSRSKDKSKSDKRDRRKEKRREIERYDVRALIAEKPRRMKDKFGRDIRETPSRSRSKSVTPPVIPHRSPSRTRQSPPRRRQRARSLTRSRSRSRGRKRSRSKNKKRRRSPGSKGREKRRRKSRERIKKKKARSHSRHHSPSPERRQRVRKRHSLPREWTPSISPSWTPPHVAEPMQPRNFTVILPNDANKKKKEKRKVRSDKRSSDRQGRKRKRNDRTPPPSKEVFASGDNILVSVSFNKENETRDVSLNKKKRDEELARRRKEKRRRLNRKNLDVSNIKPVAVIDLERSPFREITSPKDVIVLTDSDNEANDISNIETGLCDSSQQVASPERCVTNYQTGPKTPPEPQVKFTLNAKQAPLRVINNPLGDDLENEIDAQEELEQRLNDIYNKGPNTPPEPPNSPPSSPDAYDPFEPTKSRSPTPEPLAINPPNEAVIPLEENREESILIESIRTGISEIMGKGTAPLVTVKNADPRKSHTPPAADVQPADSQSSLQPATPDSNVEKSPELSQSVGAQASNFSSLSSKPVAQTIPFSTVQTGMITSTPVSTTMAPRINILNNTVITPSANSSIPQRIVLPNTVKSSPVKISPTKPTIKSTPIKPMPTKNIISKPQPRKMNISSQISNEVSEMLDFDSPYSPGSSDYEDLFEPPPETTNRTKNKNSKSPGKIQNIFDVLFGGTQALKSTNKTNRTEKTKYKKVAVTPTTKGSKLVGVKLDEDSLKILDDLPSSAVEMQVKDKFLKKLNRQERVVEEVKLVLKPHYNKKRITKEEYKDIMRKAVPKICHNKSGEINPTKIKNLIEAYVKKVRHSSKKVTSSSSVNPQKLQV